MKKVLSSKGVFEITNSLYENIKKNNPELLIERKNTKVIPDYEINKDLYADIFNKVYGRDWDKSEEEEMINMIKEKGFKDTSDFEKGLRNIKGKDDNISSENNSENKENEREIFVDTLKNAFGEDNFNKLTYDEVNKKFEEWNEKDNKGKEEIFDEIGKKFSGMKSLSDDNPNAYAKANKKFSAINKLSDKKEDDVNDVQFNEILVTPEIGKKRLDIFQDSYITNDSIRYLYNIFKKIKNKKSQNIIDEINRINGNIQKPKEEKKEINNESYNKLNEDNTNTNTNTNNENDKAKEYRKLILGINDSDYNLLRDGTDKQKENLLNDLSQSDSNILNLLSDEEFKEFANTLTFAIKGQDEEKKENAEKIYNNIVNISEKFLFETQVSRYVDKFYEELIKTVNSRVLPGSCIFNYFGKKSGIIFKTIPGFLENRLKKIYVDNSRNEGNVSRDIRADRIYMSIPQDLYWQNAAVINCNTTSAYNNVVKAIGDINRNELNIQQRLISTGLKTNTIIYTLTPDDKIDLNNLKDLKMRNGKTFEKVINDYNDNILNKQKDKRDILKLGFNEQRMIPNLKRKYFIIVTEGLFKKGELLSKIGNKIGNFINRNTNANTDLSWMTKVR